MPTGDMKLVYLASILGGVSRSLSKKMTVPLLVMWGASGPTANAPVLEAWNQVAVDVRGGPIDGAAHYVHEQQPQEVGERILAFADEIGV